MVAANLLPHGDGEVCVFTIGNAEAAGTTADAQFGQLLGFFDRQAAETYGVEQLKDSSIGPNAERERDDGYGGETGAPGESAQGVTDIAEQAVEGETPRPQLRRAP